MLFLTIIYKNIPKLTKMEGIIYKYINKLNNKIYIGQTLYEKERKEAHFIAPANCKFHRAIHYYGWINFEYEVIERVEQSKLSERERYWINYYDSVNSGYNTMSKSATEALERKTIYMKQGKHCSSLPFGYEHRNKDGKIYINEVEANIVRSIFNEYKLGSSFKELTKKYALTSNSILHNIRYVGDNNFPQIITQELFDEVQSIINSARHKPRKGIKCIIGGIEYNSISEAAKATNIDRRKIRKDTLRMSCIDAKYA